MPHPTPKFALALLAGASLPQLACGQAATAPEFAAPVRLGAGDKLLGQSRLYPSPVWHDMNADGRPDVVVGDLRGHLTWAPRLPGAKTAFGAEQKLEDAAGKVIDFHNW